MRRTLIGLGILTLAAVGGYTVWASGSGRFDLAMTGCQFSCATTVEHDAKDLAPQPGVVTGQLTQCPVSGVVFAADENRPHVQVASHDYVTCCETCAEKLRKDPARFLN